MHRQPYREVSGVVQNAPAMACAAAAALFAAAAAAEPVYLNAPAVAVTVGPNTRASTGDPAEPFNNLSTARSLANVIDAPSATAAEDHNQQTHVWVTGTLELKFDLRAEYELSALHFWNYFTESYDVDAIDLTLFDASGRRVGALSVTPALGGSGGNPIFAEDYALEFPSRVRFVDALLTGSNGQVDFNNIGFTGERSPPPRPIVITAAGELITAETGTRAQFRVALAQRPGAAVTLDIDVGDASEGRVDRTRLMFSGDDWAVERAVTVIGLDDAVRDGDVAYAITLTARSDDPLYADAAPVRVAVVNLDDDTPPPDILVSNVSGATAEDGTTATFTVRLLGAPSAEVTVELRSSDPGEGTLSPQRLRFTPATASDVRVVTVSGQDDSAADGDVFYTAITLPAVSADAAFDGRNPADVQIVNRDDETLFFDQFEAKPAAGRAISFRPPLP